LKWRHRKCVAMRSLTQVLIALCVLHAILGVILPCWRGSYCFSQPEDYKSYAIINLFRDGWARVSILYWFGENNTVLIFKARLIGVPRLDSLTIIDDKELPVEYETVGKDRLLIYVLGAKWINVTYYTCTITFKREEIWVVNYTFPYVSFLVLPEKAVVLDINTLPLRIYSKDKRMVLQMPPGIVKVAYVLTLNSEVPASKKKETDVLSLLSAYIFPLAVACIGGVVAWAIMMWYQGLKVSRLKGLLDDVDKEIIRLIEDMGGKAYQYEIQDKLELPKTTLWRHIVKLKEYGILSIEKRGRTNYLKLRGRIFLKKLVRG